MLSEKMDVPEAVIVDLAAFLSEGAIRADPVGQVDVPIGEGPDRAFLAAALGGQAELFVTGDAEILRPGTVGGMAVVSPRAFWERARTPPKR